MRVVWIHAFILYGIFFVSMVLKRVFTTYSNNVVWGMIGGYWLAIAIDIIVRAIKETIHEKKTNSGP